jgi:hypothetical protein
MKTAAMARPHHRKNHKEHLQQFKHRNDPVANKGKAKGSGVFAIVGAVFGLGISYVAASGAITWIAIGTIAGLVAGYYIGKMIDKGKA